MPIWDTFSKLQSVQALRASIALPFMFSPVRIDGRVQTRDRIAAVDAFQNEPEVRVFLGQIQAAGTGITLSREFFTSSNAANRLSAFTWASVISSGGPDPALRRPRNRAVAMLASFARLNEASGTVTVPVNVGLASGA